MLGGHESLAITWVGVERIWVVIIVNRWPESVKSIVTSLIVLTAPVRRRRAQALMPRDQGEGCDSS